MTTNSDAIVNVAARLVATASANPDGIAVAQPLQRDAKGKRQYRTITFRELDEDSDRIAQGLRDIGVTPGVRLVLMVRPSVEFISLVFALFKAGVVTVLIDPGMGRRSLVRCLEASDPDGFVAIPLAHAVRTVMRRRFPNSRFHVTVGRRWWWGGSTLEQLRRSDITSFKMAETKARDPAAIIFTTGSTGPPKGVLYQHINFDRQATEIRDRYNIQPGEVDLPGFPLFALFNCAMGVTTVIPVMNPTRPADVDPRNIIEAVEDWQVTQAFGSPALWNTVGRYCDKHQIRMPSLHRVLSAGAPVPEHVIRRVRAAIAEGGEIHTPYGATEALPVASISGSEVIEDTAAKTADGEGVCVGNRFPGMEWQVIEISDGPASTMADVTPVAQGKIGELMVCGDVVTHEYFTRKDANALHKVRDGERIWHRMGDVGYLDESDRFWFCGRKGHRVQTPEGTLFTIPCEAIVNGHASIYRSALVGIGAPGDQEPVIVAEPWPENWPKSPKEAERLTAELKERMQSHPKTAMIQRVLLKRDLPVDIRHNAKIFREQIAASVAKISVVAKIS
jgi:acyl-CoA synthetase (AMP-forming)/AMP-acid ligase II